MMKHENQRSQASDVRRQNSKWESAPAGSLGETTSSLRRTAAQSATGGQARRRVSIFGAGTISCRNRDDQYSISNLQYSMFNGNSQTAPGSTRRATEGRGSVVGRGVDPADRDGAGTTPCRSVHGGGFTLIEVLVSMAVLLVLMLALTRMFVAAADITQRGTTALMRNSTGETALETLLADAEGMVVNDRLACYVEADTADTGLNGFGFDDVWFISTSGDQDDHMPYEYFHYYVTNSITTNALGAAYMRFKLMKDRMIFAVGDGAPNPFYALDPSNAQWWKDARVSGTYWDSQVLADNIVRFDIYATGWDGTAWMGGNSGIHEFDSTLGPNGLSPRGVPPAAFDIYLQITSPDVAVESGMALVPGVDAATQLKAREMMVRDSSSLFARVVPLIGAARYRTVTVYGTNNTTYYEP